MSNGSNRSNRGGGARAVRGGGGGRGAFTVGAMWGTIQNQQQTQPTNAQPIMPQNPQGTTTGTTLDAFRNMNDADTINYLNSIANNVSLPLVNGNVVPDSDIQKMIFDLGVDGRPTLVDSAQFDQMAGQTYYRGVSAYEDSNGTIIAPAQTVANDTMLSGFTRLGGGVYGDGFYFSGSRATANSYAQQYGHNDINRSAIMRMKINPATAKAIDVSTLQRRFNSESPQVRNAFLQLSSVPTPNHPNGWGEAHLTAYALKKGYNVITVKSRGFQVPIARDAMIMDRKVYVQV